MKIKTGDKVLYKGYDRDHKGQVGIYLDNNKKENAKIHFEDGDYAFLYTGEYELVEVATYTPVPKFKIGDTLWFKAIDGNIYSGLVVKGRDDKMNYKLFVENYKRYIGYGPFINYEDTTVDIGEDRLSKEQAKE